jgi:hypothetical protein
MHEGASISDLSRPRGLGHGAQMTETVRYPVRFAGSSSAAGPLTWGQLGMWSEAQLSQANAETFANLLGGGPLPPDLKIEQVLAGLGTLIGRHEALRTRFVHGDMPEQQVMAAGEAEIEVTGIAPGADVFETVSGWFPEIEGPPFDLSGGLPFRARIGTVDDEPILVVFGVSHLASDYLGTRVIMDDLGIILAGGEPAPPRMQPLRLAAHERSHAGERVLSRSLDRWRRTLAAAPPAMFPNAPGIPETPRYWRGGIRSHSAACSLRRAAERFGTDTSGVLLSAMAALIGGYTGLDRCSVRMPAGNRGRPELRRMVGTLSQETPLVIDLRAESFGTLARAARPVLLGALRHARYDPRPVAELIDDHGVELDVCFNDMWTPTAGDRPASGGPDAATTFEWEEKVESPG